MIDYYKFVKISQIDRVKNADDVCLPFVERTGAAVTTLYLTIFLRGRSATRSEKEKKQFVYRKVLKRIAHPKQLKKSNMVKKERF